MKREKQKGGWRGGRGRAPLRYYIYPKNLSPVLWEDGTRSWLSEKDYNKTLNRNYSLAWRGLNIFSSRRSAERAVFKIDDTVDLEKCYRKKRKCWRYPPPFKRQSKASESIFANGDFVRFKQTVCLYSHYDESEGSKVGPTFLAEENMLGVIVSADDLGLISCVFVGGFTGWVESRYLVLVEG